MKLSTFLEEDQFLPDKYGKHAKEQEKYKGNAIISPKLVFSDLPEGTKSLALTVLDDDAIPVGGFTWIHWVALMTNPTVTLWPEDFSRSAHPDLIQGTNSYGGGIIGIKEPKIGQAYVGPNPPDKDHLYTFTAYALDNVPELQSGFYLNELKHAMKGHLLAKASFDAIGRV